MEKTTLFTFLSICLCCCNGFTKPAPKSVGQPWPMPKSFKQTSDMQEVAGSTFKFTVSGHDCDILRAALKRYYAIVFYPTEFDTTLRFHPRNQRVTRSYHSIGSLNSLDVNIGNVCEKLPSLEMDESYQLTVGSGVAKLTSKNVWGALRGLETFSQLVYQDMNGAYLINNTDIDDAPRFQHRGVMLDTSRHYLSKNVLLASIEAMAYNKINVFHWHLVDDQSFPYQSVNYPDLSQKGAYDPYTHIYTQSDLAEIIEFARLRGVRVVPEFDTPGHTQSWEGGQPGLLAKCYSSGSLNGDYGPIDPTVNSTYDFMKGFMKEITEVFPDHYVHLGGDEVSFGCWQSNPDITNFMKKKGFGTDYAKLENYYEQNLLDIVNSYNHGYITWQEIYDNKIKVRPDTVIHIWKGDWKTEMSKVTNSSLRALLSEPWYLDYISYGKDWKNYYKVEPVDFNATAQQEALVMGGEACLWAEFVDNTNVQSRLWPRASAIAERLWSPRSVNNDTEAAPRFEEHRCRMVRRGIPAEPENGPSFCEYESKVGFHF